MEYLVIQLHIRASAKLISAWQPRIELLDVQARVWRRLLVRSGITLPAVQRVFQADWEGAFDPARFELDAVNRVLGTTGV